MSHNVNIHHIVFRTYRRSRVIPDENKRMMFKYIYNLCEMEGWRLLRINSAQNHVHILIDIPATARVSEVVQKIKANTSRVFKHHQLFPDFEKWGRRYGSFSVSFADRDKLIEYIKNHDEHHKHESFEDEIRRLFQENGLDNPDELLNDDDET